MPQRPKSTNLLKTDDYIQPSFAQNLACQRKTGSAVAYKPLG
jgi:hypothetical protein